MGGCSLRSFYNLNDWITLNLNSLYLCICHKSLGLQEIMCEVLSNGMSGHCDENTFTEQQSWCRTTTAELLFHVFVCSGVFLAAHPHTGTCRLEWWAAACPPYREARHSGRYRAPYSRSSPSLRARAGDSRSTEGWLRSLWQKEIQKESTQWQTGGGSGLEREERERG